MTELEEERDTTQTLRSEWTKLEAEYKTLQDTLASIQAAASPGGGKVEATNGHQGLDSSIDDRNPISEAGSMTELKNTAEAVTTPSASPPMAEGQFGSLSMPSPASPPIAEGQFGSLSMHPPQPSGSSPVTTPATPPSAGFRTIHGQHRPDGALGGYVNGGGTLRKASESQTTHEDSSMKAHGSTSSGSIHSNHGGEGHINGVTSGSAEEQKVTEYYQPTDFQPQPAVYQPQPAVFQAQQAKGSRRLTRPPVRYN
ncbi:hypothetical protein M409DRAFT_56635 [Zasmidium cellare ATCC 36951]|uniref:Uncharacterized protein n=1 Tax=Zasmidium cellare ATCC 36951 TaxID=1080233 RepID=A0A6A6CEK5_ZASCE|nr:uncharacterized protein M409DRAFT_56635 [Zasmidium cellare ATCC 36951]KAF2164362.1 hypothetical protein M409DRAFT_56635 [Zasmidium cellare ATCC 36951]